jgi:thioredoxin
MTVANRTRRAVDLSSAMELETDADGNVCARIVELDLEGRGADEDSAREALVHVLQAMLDNEPFREMFSEWAQGHLVTVEMSEDEIREEDEVQALASESGKDFTDLTPESFDAAIASARPVLVDFWAPWCKPCLFAAPVLKEIHDEMGDAFAVAKVNVEEHPALGERFDVQGIPCFILFCEGSEIDRIVGSAPKEQFRAEIDRVLAKA